MNNIQTFANYIADLAKEKKYDNVIVSFKNNHSDFSSQVISSNSIIIKSVIDSYRHLGRFEEAYKFLEEFNIGIETDQNNYILNSFGWLLYNELDEAIKKEAADQVQLVSTRLLEFLNVIDKSTSFYDMLIQRIIGKALGVRRFNLEGSLELLLNILKEIKFKTEVRIQQLIKNDTFIIGGISNVFGKSGKPERGFTFLEFLGLSIDDASLSEEILNAFGWLTYYQLKRDFKNVDEEVPEEELDTMFIDFDVREQPQVNQVDDKEKTNNNLLKLLPRLNKESKYSPFSKLFNLYIKIQKSAASVNWQRILEFLNVLDYNELSIDCPTVTFIRKGREKVAELASDKENWLSTYANALFRTNDYETCLVISQTALETLEKFHYNNDIWFARRIALCKIKIGDKTEAIQELEKIVIKKKEWFIEKELAELYFDDGKIDLANKYALEAALNFGDKEKKDGLYLLLGKIYKNKKSA
ncbi:tetratricopeptide repeat protein [Parafilimonas sp.]|uniref:tetratricopeptide repeat protein n=1 Tax=Parafilimonas sp. TaxID=1969739 RepID=UPI003F804F3D